MQGDWTVDSGFLGSAPVSPSVQVYTQAEDGVLTRLSLDSLRARTIGEADICRTVTDGAGNGHHGHYKIIRDRDKVSAACSRRKIRRLHFCFVK